MFIRVMAVTKINNVKDYTKILGDNKSNTRALVIISIYAFAKATAFIFFAIDSVSSATSES